MRLIAPLGKEYLNLKTKVEEMTKCWRILSEIGDDVTATLRLRLLSLIDITLCANATLFADTKEQIVSLDIHVASRVGCT